MLIQSHEMYVNPNLQTYIKVADSTSYFREVCGSDVYLKVELNNESFAKTVYVSKRLLPLRVLLSSYPLTWHL